MTLPILNLNNHTPFSDGAYTVDELCDAHLSLPCEPVAGLGISDHLFRTPSSREISSERDFHRVFGDETRSHIRQLRDARARWAGRIQVFVGAKVIWSLNKLMLGPMRELLAGLDYVLFEQVDWAGLTTLANQSRRWPCPIGLAHTRVQQAFPSTSLDQVIRTMANARIFYELSVHFLPISARDPWMSLLPQHRVPLSIGSDTHDDLGVLRCLAPMAEVIEQFGLADRLFTPGPREPALEAQSA